MTGVASVDARTGSVRAVIAEESASEVATICTAAAAAAGDLRRRGRVWRAGLLRAMAAELEADRGAIVTVADQETALGRTRLEAELTRTVFQLQMFADVVDEGGYVEAVVDHRRDTPMGPMPDLRRMLVPIGPVAVFAASNFPLAFSVPGGDTASALAAGCPVVIKVHEGHPDTSRLCFEAMSRAAGAHGAPAGTLALVHGRAAGVALVLHPAVTAVGFTGSERGARALMRAMDSRDIPIPFYGELGSINPVVVLPGAAAARATELGLGLAVSATTGAGQFCTKPGVALVPVGSGGDAVVDAAASAFARTTGAVMLTPGIADAYRLGSSDLVATAGVRERARGQEGSAAPAPLLLEVPASALAGRLVEECFGPVCLVARYDDVASLPDLLGGLPASLTATLHHDAGADEPSVELLDALAQVAGRVLFNGFPTGVAVTWAQTHGGGWPASNSLHTSVGPTAVRRFMRPVTWQDAPTSALPEELRDDAVEIPRRVDGELLARRRSTVRA